MKVTAKVSRTGGWWAIEVAEVPGAFTQTRRLDQVEAMVRDAVALLTDTSGDDIDVELIPPTDYQDTVAEALDAKHRAEEAQERASVEMRKAARTLIEDSGLTVRDTGRILGLTPQRVSQLTKR